MKQSPDLVVAVGDRPPGKEGDGNLEAMSAASNVDTVPLDTLSMPDDQEQMQPPEVGDEVNYQVTGKVVAIEGNIAKVQRTSINGQEVQDNDEDDENQNPDNADAAESQGLRDQAGGMGMMGLIIALLLLSIVGSSAQSVVIKGNAIPTNALVAASVPVKLYTVMGYNSANSTEFVQIFQTNNVPASGATPVFSMPVFAGQPYSYDFSYYGADFDSVTVGISTTAQTYTADSNFVTIQAIIKSR